MTRAASLGMLSGKELHEMMASTAWQNDPRLRDMGRITEDRAPDPQLSARTAARLLFGAVGLAAARYGVEEMHRACAELVRHDDAWRTKFRVLPRGVDGRVSDAMMLITGMARSILPMAGADHMRIALAFWASARDPDMWREMAPSD